ncbi:hypothetical protein CPB86DRAFT_565652 [Serendipita vermifera]|nr:hypothetical protein CPB86DRAFT_565652 [Serendipita vermifera]
MACVATSNSRTAPPHYPWLGENNLMNTNHQQQTYHHPRSSSLDFSRDPNYRAGEPSGVAQHGQRFVPLHSSLNASGSGQSGNANGARPQVVENAGYSGSSMTNTTDPPPMWKTRTRTQCTMRIFHGLVLLIRFQLFNCGQNARVANSLIA